MKIEQLLHGYDNGHRLLAGSVLLKNSAEMDAVATLSDWSEYVAPGGGESSYVTAYPLQESGYYVIAKTWYADEMKRPGCVWTHSLLIPFDALNHLDDFKRLSHLFKRPSLDSSLDEYSRIIEYENKNYSADDYNPVSVNRKIELIVLQAFINAGNEPLVLEAQKDNELVEDGLLSVMNTLPRQMLQKISWCTGTAYIRKMNGNPLTCQFVSRNTNGMLSEGSVVEEQWQTYVLNAIMRGDVNQGQLIRMFAEDIEDNEENYAAIAKALYTLEDYFKVGKKNEERFKEVLEFVAGAFPDKEKGMVIKKLLVNKTFTDRYCKNYTFFLFFATSPVDEAFDDVETGLGERWEFFLSRERNQYLPLLSNICKSGQANGWGLEKMKKSVGILSSEEVTDMIKNDFHLFSSIALLNPELLNETPWLVLSNQEIESILPMILDERDRSVFKHWERMFMVLLEKGVEISSGLAAEIFTKTDKATGILLDFVNRDSSRYVNYVLGNQLEHKAEAVLTWLSSVEVITDNIAYAIVNAVDERSNLVTSRGAKAWKPFLGLQFHSLNAKVYAYLFALSFNWSTDGDALELMRMAFYPLHTLQAKKQLGYSNWSHIAPYMESVMIWDEWDNCKKMRKTVVKRLKRAGANASVMDNYTPDSELNAELKRMW